MTRTSLIIGLAASLVGAIVPAAAQAQYDGRGGYDRGYVDQGRGYDRSPRGGARYAPGDYYEGHSGYGPSAYYGGRGYDDGRGRQGGYRGRCSSGTGGTIIGAIAGGLLGSAAAGRGDGAAATIAGAGVGALLGRGIDRSTC